VADFIARKRGKFSACGGTFTLDPSPIEGEGESGANLEDGWYVCDRLAERDG
jgi:hypothetical protein